MELDILREIEEYSSEISELRKTIHRHPEMGNHEWQTSELIENYLNGIGIRTERILGTAVIGRLDGRGDGKTVGLRADMDALPLTEVTGVEFASENPCVMHACGHDVHTAAVLGAARVLAAHREELPGNVVFFFQPDEEGHGGAERMIREGCMEGVDAVFGAHVTPDLPEGHIGVRGGKFYAASDMFTVKVIGKSSHGAVREKGIDALAAAAEMVTALLAVPAQVTSDKCVLTVGRMQSGTAGNILSGDAEFEGIIRTLGPETRAAMEEAFRGKINEITKKTGTAAEITYTHSHPGVVNDEAMTDLAERSAQELFGKDRVHRIEEPTMISEDFGCFITDVPGSFYHIGAGCSLPLHNPGFIPGEGVVCDLAAMHVKAVTDYLSLTAL